MTIKLSPFKLSLVVKEIWMKRRLNLWGKTCFVSVPFPTSITWAFMGGLHHQRPPSSTAPAWVMVECTVHGRTWPGSGWILGREERMKGVEEKKWEREWEKDVGVDVSPYPSHYRSSGTLRWPATTSYPPARGGPNCPVENPGEDERGNSYERGNYFGEINGFTSPNLISFSTLNPAPIPLRNGEEEKAVKFREMGRGLMRCVIIWWGDIFTLHINPIKNLYLHYPFIMSSSKSYGSWTP